MKVNGLIGIITILIISTPIFFTPLVQANDQPTYTEFYFAFVIGKYTTIENNRLYPRALDLTGKFFLIGPGWFNPPGYGGPYFSICCMAMYTQLDALIFTGVFFNHHIIGVCLAPVGE